MAEDGPPRPPCPTNAHPRPSRCEAHCLVFHPPALHEALHAISHHFSQGQRDVVSLQCKNGTAPPHPVGASNRKVLPPSQGTEAHSVLLLKDLVRPASRNNALRLTKQRPSRPYHVHRQNANRGYWQFGVTSRNPHTGESIPGCVRHRESGV